MRSGRRRSAPVRLSGVAGSGPLAPGWDWVTALAGAAGSEDDVLILIEVRVERGRRGPTATGGARSSIEASARLANAALHFGTTFSCCVAPGLEGYGRLPSHGILGVEMEAAALYTLAARFGVKALAVCTMTDCLITHAELSAEDRQSSLKDMVALALDVAVDG